MPKSMVLFAWLACLATALRLAPAALDPRPDLYAATYNIAMVVLRLAVIWTIVQRRSNVLRWCWIGFAVISAGVNMLHQVAQPGDPAGTQGALLIAYNILMLVSAGALFMPASGMWLRATPQFPP